MQQCAFACFVLWGTGIHLPRAPQVFSLSWPEALSVEYNCSLGRKNTIGKKRAPSHTDLSKDDSLPCWCSALCACIIIIHIWPLNTLGVSGHMAIVQLSGEYGREGKDQTHAHTHTRVSHFLYTAWAVWFGGWYTALLKSHWIMSVPKISVSAQVGRYFKPSLNSVNAVCGLDELC